MNIEKLIKEADITAEIAKGDRCVLAFPIDKPRNEAPSSEEHNKIAEDAFDPMTPLTRFMEPSSSLSGPASIFDMQESIGSQQEFSRPSAEAAFSTSMMMAQNGIQIRLHWHRNNSPRDAMCQLQTFVPTWFLLKQNELYSFATNLLTAIHQKG